MMMTRIVAGSAKGRSLRVPKSGTRPTSGRVREALFSRLEHLGYIADCRVLDLFSGCGALALEALSRGAAGAVCVECAPSAVKIIAENAEKLGFGPQCEVVGQKVSSFLAGCAAAPARPYDLVFLDPPYDLPQACLTDILQALRPCLLSDSLVVAERRATDPKPVWPVFLRACDWRKWGDTGVWTAKFCGSGNTMET